VVDDLDLPHGGGLGVRHRVASGPAAGSGFRQALALQHFTRKVERMREPFLLIVGYGRTGELSPAHWMRWAGASW
jgi:hypothetical protein